MKIRFVALSLAVSLAGRLGAQYGPAQDSTLVGVRRIALNVTSTLRGPNTFRDEIALELRKAGIRITADSSRPDSVDAVVNVLVRASRGNNYGSAIRIDVEQRARLVRTGNTHRMVTWFYEDEGDGAYTDRWLPQGVKRAVDAFLTKWLDMNGR